MRYLEIVNWSEYQHYTNRNPPWIKLHNRILDCYEYGCLQDDSKLLLISLYLLASRTENKIPSDPEWIKSKAMLKAKINLKPLIDSEFIRYIDDIAQCLQDDSGTIAECKQNGVTETETETETEKIRKETEKSKSRNGPLSFSFPDWIPKITWTDYKEHRQKLKAPMTQKAEELAFKKLADLKAEGFDPVMVINQSINCGWKGLFPIKDNGDRSAKPTRPLIKSQVCSKCHKAPAVVDDLCKACYGVAPMPEDFKETFSHAFKSMDGEKEMSDFTMNDRQNDLRQQAMELKEILEDDDIPY